MTFKQMSLGNFGLFDPMAQGYIRPFDFPSMLDKVRDFLLMEYGTLSSDNDAKPASCDRALF